MKRLALCIGNENYTIMPKLTCAKADAEAMKEAFDKLGFNTVLRFDLEREDLANAIYEFDDQIDNYDAVVIYYAGHGFQVNNDNILAPIDLNIQARDELVRMNAFPLNDLLTVLNRHQEQTKIVILDACRNNLGFRGTFNNFFAPISAPQGSIIAFSTSPGQSAIENAATGHGKYTEALLQYLSLPRVPIETVFKKVRESLSAETGGTQIPWEHTSLIGEFYFNPDTIYDGTNYESDALADAHFHFSNDSSIKEIVQNLKSYNWPTQERAINAIDGIDFEKSSSNELFVLGRNIYQSADGNCFASQRYIDRFEDNKTIPDEAKTHLLNGMAYEIYYNHENKLRDVYKFSYAKRIIYYLELAEFYASKTFIASHLCKIEDRPIYIPGQNEMMYLEIHVQQDGECYRLDNIMYQGKNIYSFDVNDELNEFPRKRLYFEQTIADKLGAPLENIRYHYNISDIGESDQIILENRDLHLSFVSR